MESLSDSFELSQVSTAKLKFRSASTKAELEQRIFSNKPTLRTFRAAVLEATREPMAEYHAIYGGVIVVTKEALLTEVEVYLLERGGSEQLVKMLDHFGIDEEILRAAIDGQNRKWIGVHSGMVYSFEFAKRLLRLANFDFERKGYILMQDFAKSQNLGFEAVRFVFDSLNQLADMGNTLFRNDPLLGQLKGQMRNAVVSSRFRGRVMAKAMGFLVGTCSPVRISAIAGLVASNDLTGGEVAASLLKAEVEPIIEEAISISGDCFEIQRGTVYPRDYLEMRDEVLRKLLAEKHYISYSDLNEYGVTSPGEYMKKLSSDGVSIPSGYVSGAFFEILGSSIGEHSETLIDLSGQISRIVDSSLVEDLIGLVRGRDPLMSNLAAGEIFLLGGRFILPKSAQDEIVCIFRQIIAPSHNDLQLSALTDRIEEEIKKEVELEDEAEDEMEKFPEVNSTTRVEENQGEMEITTIVADPSVSAKGGGRSRRIQKGKKGKRRGGRGRYEDSDDEDEGKQTQSDARNELDGGEKLSVKEKRARRRSRKTKREPGQRVEKDPERNEKSTRTNEEEQASGSSSISEKYNNFRARLQEIIEEKRILSEIDTINVEKAFECLVDHFWISYKELMTEKRLKKSSGETEVISMNELEDRFKKSFLEVQILSKHLNEDLVHLSVNGTSLSNDVRNDVIKSYRKELKKLFLVSLGYLVHSVCLEHSIPFSSLEDSIGRIPVKKKREALRDVLESVQNSLQDAIQALLDASTYIGIDLKKPDKKTERAFTTAHFKDVRRRLEEYKQQLAIAKVNLDENLQDICIQVISFAFHKVRPMCVVPSKSNKQIFGFLRVAESACTGTDGESSKLSIQLQLLENMLAESLGGSNPSIGDLETIINTILV